jgi:subtilisin family serine protease
LTFSQIPGDNDYAAIVNDLKNVGGLETVSPFYAPEVDGGIGTSNYFSVKLKRAEDSTLLHHWADSLQAIIVKQDPFAPLWFTLSRTATSVHNSVAMSNLFYEAGFCELIDPGFMFDFQLSCTNDPDFGALWGLNNTANPDVDINACPAWNISTGAGVKVAVVDKGIDKYHVDLMANMAPISYDCISGTPAIVYENDSHGTHVGGTIGAVRNNNNQVVGVAPDCKLVNISSKFGEISQRPGQLAGGFNWATAQGVEVINNSWGGSSISVYNSSQLNDAIANAIQNGRGGKGAVVIFATGNNNRNYVDYPGNANPAILNVGSIDNTGHRANPPGGEGSNYGTQLDVVAPGEHILSTVLDDATGYKNGTSMAAPHVAGVAALIIAANPCIKGEDVCTIIERTAQKVGGYDYQYHNGRPNGSWHAEMGYGLVDACAAVALASVGHVAGADLYCKDALSDVGIGGWAGTGSNSNRSPDIWIRNQQDGLTNFASESPVFQNGGPYIYVRVRNRGCSPSSGSGRLKLYWSKAATASSWPAHWDGSQPAVGNLIDNRSLPVLQPGEDVILEISGWMLPNVSQTWNACLLARIEDETGDPITTYPGALNLDVALNNNIALRNVTILDGKLITPRPSTVEVGNVKAAAKPYRFVLEVPGYAASGGSAADITKDAEVKLSFDETGWNLFESAGQFDQPGIAIVGNREIVVSVPSVTFANVLFPADTRVPITFSYTFLSREAGPDSIYAYALSQYPEEAPDSLIGSETFELFRAPEASFLADAGPDKSVNKNSVVTLSAVPVSGNVTYNWYDSTGTLVHAGQQFSMSPEVSQRYKLEVLSNSEWYKDYDAVNVHVKDKYITQLYPNPANAQVTVTYEAATAASAYLMVTHPLGTTVQNYILDPALTQFSINTSGYAPGIYSVVLVADGQQVDSKTLNIN